MVFVFLLVAILLTITKLKAPHPMLLADRFLPGSGWLEILLVASYGAFIAHQLSDYKKIAIWRGRLWTLFSVVFFSQLLLGLAVSDLFLMSGKLHLPIPAIIIAGPIYRWQLSVMTILFLSTILLSGSAWCSHYCYFGALDGVASRGKTSKSTFQKFKLFKYTFLPLLVVGAFLFRWFDVSWQIAVGVGASIGVLGILSMLYFSGRYGKMFHCTVFCPLGTLTHLIGKINPFRVVIASSCTSCMVCKTSCKYDALNGENILAKKPGITCTLCGDCLSSCHNQSLQYKFFNLSPKRARDLFVLISVTLHAVSLALARI
ncbi:MAG: 4Fe-4S binding protein [Breznakibacter sp.]|nr:4Fe-4S binding protein [Breznakibacter sp.]